MSKADERAAKARSLILQGEQKSKVAEQMGYKSIGGMMGAIVMFEHRQKTGKSVSHEIKKAAKAPGAEPIFRKERQEEKIDLLADEPKKKIDGLRVNVERSRGMMYARIEGEHLTGSYIGYRRSFNIEVKGVTGRHFRMFETEIGKRGSMLQAIKELHDITGRMIALIEECDAKDQ